MQIMDNCRIIILILHTHQKDGTSTNVGPTNIGLYKGRTVQTADLQTSDWYKCRTGTNVGLVQKSDWYKRQTETNIGLVQMSDQYKRRVGLVHL